MHVVLHYGLKLTDFLYATMRNVQGKLSQVMQSCNSKSLNNIGNISPHYIFKHNKRFLFWSLGKPVVVATYIIDRL